MKSNYQNQELQFIQFTALWAFTETSLGGLMHALHLPFTGIFVGGIAVLILILMGQQFNFSSIAKSTLLVVFVKLIASPQSPPAAYLAVGFQGITAALLFNVIPFKVLTSYLFAVLAMCESAIQKILVMTLINGKAFWDAIDAFGHTVQNDLGFSAGEKTSFSWTLIYLYIGIYVIWGFCLAFWALKILLKSKTQSEELQIIHKKYAQLAVQTQGNWKKKMSFWGIMFYLIFISILWISGISNEKLIYLTLRSLIGLLALIYLINPLISYFLKKWMQKQNESSMPYVQLVMNLQPQFNLNWEIAKMYLSENQYLKHKKIKQIELFILLSIQCK
jgi:hypothetical protein